MPTGRKRDRSNSNSDRGIEDFETTAKSSKRGRVERHIDISNEIDWYSNHRLKPIVDGEVYYIPGFIEESEASKWYEELQSLDTWYHPKLKVYGKEVNQSRSIAAYASDESLVVKYSGHTVTLHHTSPALLSQVQTLVETKLDETFNHVMLNRYADGNEYIGRHRDTKQNNVIASLSLGAERTMIFTKNKTGDVIRLKLGNGSLLLMKGDTQKNWKHEIPKESAVQGGRISLTFRQLSS